MARLARKVTRTAPRILFCGVAMLVATPIWAQSNIVHVEEHWELKLGQPDQDRSAPQTTMVMSPTGDLGGLHFLFTINHLTAPQYEPGGMQVQVWDGDHLIDDQIADEYGALAHADETVRWAQRLTLDGSKFLFQVRDGESETWGAFGGDNLAVSAPTSLVSLNGYKPGISITESQVGYAENRVVSLTLTKLIWVTDDGEVHEMNAPIAVDTSLDP